uniref:PKD_channel domain-containing protein n=1 Tax=Steinernema glaseri TaxID=37863 RepID=A0A1I8A6W4_9BILA
MSSAEAVEVGNTSTTVTNGSLVAGSAIFSDNPFLQMGMSLFNLINIGFVIAISFKIEKKDVSRLYTLWVYFANAPNEATQIVISVLQLLGLVDSSGHWYRHYIDFIQIFGKFLGEIAANIYRTLAFLLLTATFMCYAAPFSFARMFHPTTCNCRPPRLQQQRPVDHLRAFGRLTKLATRPLVLFQPGLDFLRILLALLVLLLGNLRHMSLRQKKTHSIRVQGATPEAASIDHNLRYDTQHHCAERRDRQCLLDCSRPKHSHPGTHSGSSTHHHAVALRTD